MAQIRNPWSHTRKVRAIPCVPRSSCANVRMMATNTPAEVRSSSKCSAILARRVYLSLVEGNTETSRRMAIGGAPSNLGGSTHAVQSQILDTDKETTPPVQHLAGASGGAGTSGR